MPAIASFDTAYLAKRRLTSRSRELTAPTSSSRKVFAFFGGLIAEDRSTSKFLQVEREYQELWTSLELYANLANNWDSYGAEKPSRASVEATAEILGRLREELFLPNRVVPSSEGGIAVYFNKDNKTGYLEYRNSGDVILAMYDNQNDPSIIELTRTDADKSKAISLIRSYITED